MALAAFGSEHLGGIYFPFVYHCHLLEHEDGGMMGTIRVDPAGAAETAPSVAPR